MVDFVTVSVTRIQCHLTAYFVGTRRAIFIIFICWMVSRSHCTGLLLFMLSLSSYSFFLLFLLYFPFLFYSFCSVRGLGHSIDSTCVLYHDFQVAWITAPRSDECGLSYPRIKNRITKNRPRILHNTPLWALFFSSSSFSLFSKAEADIALAHQPEQLLVLLNMFPKSADWETSLFTYHLQSRRTVNYIARYRLHINGPTRVMGIQICETHNQLLISSLKKNRWWH